VTSAASNTSHLELSRRMAGLTPPLFVMGGFAEDALLHGRITQPRDDLDLLVERKGLETCLRQLASLGISALETQLTASSGRPLCLRSRSPDPAIEIWLCELAPSGRYSLELPGSLLGQASDAGRFRLLLPEDTFDSPPAALEGVSIQAVSPLALYLLRETSARTRGRESDRAVCAELKAGFLMDCEPELPEPDLA
jgi:hypothetical protein